MFGSIRTHTIEPIRSFKPRRAALSIGDPDLRVIYSGWQLFFISTFFKTGLAATFWAWSIPCHPRRPGLQHSAWPPFGSYGRKVSLVIGFLLYSLALLHRSHSASQPSSLSLRF